MHISLKLSSLALLAAGAAIAIWQPGAEQSALAEDMQASTEAKCIALLNFKQPGMVIESAILPPQWSIDLQRNILKHSGPAAKKNLQFFMVPGVQHCMGGPGADAFGQIGAAQPEDSPERSVAVALEHWVEKGRLPMSLIGRRNGIMSMYAPGAAGAERQKLHCAWPKRAVLKAGGDQDKASDYSCKGK